MAAKPVTTIASVAQPAGDKGVRARILLRALRWRSGSAVMLFLVATVAIAAAAIGPMFLQAADDSVTATAVQTAPAGEASISLVLSGGLAAQHTLVDAVAASDRVAGTHALTTPIYGGDLGEHFFTDTTFGLFSADVVSRTAVCSHVHIVHGSCPTKEGTVAISVRSAAEAHVGIGTVLHLGVARAPRLQPVKIVGLYIQPATVENNYWRGNDLFAYGTTQGNGAVHGIPVTIAGLDPLFATSATVLHLGSVRSPVQWQAVLSWQHSAIVNGRAPLEHSLGAIESAVTRYAVTVSTSLGQIIAGAQRDENVMSSVVLAIVLQLVLLSLLVVYALGRSAAAARSVETEFARRRGFPRSALLSLAVGEPAALIAAAFPTGILVAWITLQLTATTLFVPGTPRSVTGFALAGAAAGFAGALIATTLASYTLWRRPRSKEARTSGVLSFTLDAFGVALALAGLLALATRGSLNGSHADPLAAIAPGLLALGAAIIGLRLASTLVAILVKKSRESGHVAWFIALRQVARRPEVLRRLLPLTAATAVVLFAIGSFVVAADNRSRAASFETGAARVVDVSLAPGVDLVRAVRTADPTGREAMAAAVYITQSENLVAVDATRLAAVASWPSGLSVQSPAALGRMLTPKTYPAVTFHGDWLQITVDLPAGTPSLVLSADIYDNVYQTSESIPFGPIRPGVHTYYGWLQGACGTSCRLTDLSPQWADANTNFSGSVSLDVRSIAVSNAPPPRPSSSSVTLASSVSRASAVWRPVPFGLGERGSWRSETPGVSASATKPGVRGLAISVPGSFLIAGGILVAPADVPPALPAVVTNELEQLDPPSEPGSQISLEGLDGGSLTVSAVGVVAALPEIGQNALLVSLPLAELAQTNAAIGTTYQVWLAPSASPRILKRLSHLGVTIGPSNLASARLGVLDHRGLALAYDLALIVSPIAALLALGAVVFTIGSEGRARRREIAALSTVGVPRAELGRALWLENGFVLVVALIIGGAIGLSADALAISSLPEFANGSGGVPVTTAVPFGALLLALAALAVALAVGAAIASRVVFHSAFTRRQAEDI